VASLAAMVTIPAVAAATGRPGREIAAACGIAAVVVLRHRENMSRLLRGQEQSLR